MTTTDMIKMVRAIEGVIESTRYTSRDKVMVFCEALERHGLTVTYDPAKDHSGDQAEIPQVAA